MTSTAVNAHDDNPYSGKYLEATHYFNYDHPKVVELFEKIKPGTDKEMAIEAYYLVRDPILYSAEALEDGADGFRASYAMEKGYGTCLPKAALMIALCRKAGIPARIGLADVTNHLATPKLTEMLRSDIFSMHGYADIYIDGKWVKATPAFNKALCNKTGTHPLEFNGEEDSIFHEFTADGSKHMEYLKEHGTFAELPVDYIFENFRHHYPHLAGVIPMGTKG